MRRNNSVEKCKLLFALWRTGTGMQLDSDLRFQSEEDAYRFVEACVWPNGATCPRCGEVKRVGRLKGSSTRIGTYKCYRCRKPFTVKINTVFEASHVLMHVWLKAIFLIGLSRRAIESKDLVRILEVSPRTADFILARVRRAIDKRDPAHFFAHLSDYTEKSPWSTIPPITPGTSPDPSLQSASRPRAGGSESS